MAFSKSAMKSKPQIILTLLAASLFCFGQSSFAISTPITNIVTNGGFETGDFTGWTISGNTGGGSTDGSFSNIGVNSSSAYSGNYGAYFGPVGSLAYLSQNLTTIAGMAYDLSFFLINEGSGGEGFVPIRPGGGPIVQEFQVFWNGVLIYSIPPNADPSSYSQLNFSGLIATSTTTELKFGFRNDPSFWDIDDIVAGAPGGASVPETLSTIWLLLPVVGMFALLQVRRRIA